MPDHESPKRHPLFPRPFLVWIVVLYTLLGIVIVGGGHLTTAVQNWPMAIAMAVGSYIAGSTPMGGGTIGFPVLVLIFGESAAIGRDFSFAIQAIGMTSAGVLVGAVTGAVDGFLSPGQEALTPGALERDHLMLAA